MLHSLITCCSLLPVFVLAAPILKTSSNNQTPIFRQHPQTDKLQTFVRSAPAEVIALNEISTLQTYMTSRKNITPQESYDYLSARLKELEFKDQPAAREIFYTMLSFLRIQPNIMSSNDLRNQVDTLIKELNFLYKKQQKDFLSWTSHLQKLLNPKIFIHLDHKQMANCLDIFDRLHNTVEASSSLANDPNGEGASLFDPNLFLNKESENAREIYLWIVGLEKLAASFAENCNNLSQNELAERVSAANEFINNLKDQAILINDQEIPISRNARKHLQNIARSVINALTARIAEISTTGV